MVNAKRALQTAAGRLGYAIAKVPPVPFPELRGLPRYVPQDTVLKGHPFHLTDAPSFLAGYREIFQDEIYKFQTARAAPIVVDCGANIGMSVAYFKHRYPEARITAVEADPGIFAVLSGNVERAGYSDVRLINKAVSGSNTPLVFHSEGADGGRVHSLGDAKSTNIVEAVMLDALIDGPVDFLKIDIEGAETEALERCSKLAQVDQMFIEYHSFEDSEQTLQRLLSVLKDNGFRYYIHTQLCSPAPLSVDQVHMGMDLQLNVFAKRRA